MNLHVVAPEWMCKNRSFYLQMMSSIKPFNGLLRLFFLAIFFNAVHANIFLINHDVKNIGIFFLGFIHLVFKKIQDLVFLAFIVH